jgi:hypothetical protein
VLASTTWAGSVFCRRPRFGSRSCFRWEDRTGLGGHLASQQGVGQKLACENCSLGSRSACDDRVARLGQHEIAPISRTTTAEVSEGSVSVTRSGGSMQAIARDITAPGPCSDPIHPPPKLCHDGSATMEREEGLWQTRRAISLVVCRRRKSAQTAKQGRARQQASLSQFVPTSPSRPDRPQRNRGLVPALQAIKDVEEDEERRWRIVVVNFDFRSNKPIDDGKRSAVALPCSSCLDGVVPTETEAASLQRSNGPVTRGRTAACASPARKKQARAACSRGRKRRLGGAGRSDSECTRPSDFECTRPPSWRPLLASPAAGRRRD